MAHEVKRHARQAASQAGSGDQLESVENLLVLRFDRTCSLLAEAAQATIIAATKSI